MTDLYGKAVNCPGFTFGSRVEVWESCAVTYQNQFFVYGGYTYTPTKADNKQQWAGMPGKKTDPKYGLVQSTVSGPNLQRQISKVINKTLKRIGTLPFDFRYGGCTSTKSEIILCFHSVGGKYKTCYKTTNATSQFKETAKSIYDHKQIKLASSECKC